MKKAVVVDAVHRTLLSGVAVNGVHVKGDNKDGHCVHKEHTITWLKSMDFSYCK